MLNENVKSNIVQENKIPFILICGLKTDVSVKTCQIRYFNIISAYIHNILWQMHHHFIHTTDYIGYISYSVNTALGLPLYILLPL